MECVFVGYGDIARFFGNDDGQGIGFLRYAFGGTVALSLILSECPCCGIPAGCSLLL